MRSPLEVLPQDVTDMLNANSYFVDVPVFFYREGRIAEEIDAALDGVKGKANKVGVAVVVNMPIFEADRETPGPMLTPSINVQCIEHPVLNFGDLGTQKTAEQIGQQVAEILQHHFANLYYSALYPVEQGFITPSRENKEHVTYNVRFKCRIPLDDRARVAMPTMAFGDGGAGLVLVTMNCATLGAAIRYTTDESFPVSTSPLYTGPALAAQNTLFRARGYLAGLEGSFVEGRIAKFP